jgi:hypothetical protein
MQLKNERVVAEVRKIGVNLKHLFFLPFLFKGEPTTGFNFSNCEQH